MLMCQCAVYGTDAWLTHVQLLSEVSGPALASGEHGQRIAMLKCIMHDCHE